jgi:leucyl-tRNA synthetase
MSKSRGNVVVPDDYIARWGADAFRMYLMFLGPFQEGGDFRDDGLNGPRRFLEKLWALVHQSLREDAAGGEIHHPILVKWHQTKKKVTHDMERLGYNTAIAAQMELLNVMREANCAERTIVEDMLLMVAPFAPHFAEETWERLGHDRSIFDARWPTWDEALTVEDTVELAVQVNGKTRGKVMVRRDAGVREAVAAAYQDPTIRKYLKDEVVVAKEILVPNRLLNLVVR